jgi:hypothetical protein
MACTLHGWSERFETRMRDTQRKGSTMQRATYHVLPNADGTWQVKAEGATRAWRIHDSRETAVNEALNLVRAFGRGEVLVHDHQEAGSADDPA